MRYLCVEKSFHGFPRVGCLTSIVRDSLAIDQVRSLQLPTRRTSVRPFVLLILSPALAVAQTTHSSESYLTQAQELEGHRNYAGAEAIYQEALVAFRGETRDPKKVGHPLPDRR